MVEMRKKQDTALTAQPTSQKSIWPYGVFAIGIVPVYTFLFACQGDLITTNLSQLGNRPGSHSRFIFWGLLCATFFFVLFTRIFEMAGYGGAVGRGLLLGACASFVLCVLLPFVPEKYPLAAKWHNKTGIMAALLTAALSLVLSLCVRRVDRRLCVQSVLLWAVQVGVCMVMVRTSGISGLVESVFIVWTGLHAYRIMHGLQKMCAARSEAAEAAALLESA